MNTPILERGWLRLGELSIGRVGEWSGPLFTRSQLLPTSTYGQWLAEADWLAPQFWDPNTDAVLAALQIHVIRTADRTIVVDTGMGNGKRRPSTPPLDELDGPFLRRLEYLGVACEDVDTVLCTHLHPDHVGWNTRWDGHCWQPTFPNARYVLPIDDYDMLRKLSPSADHMNYRDALADSIDPVVAHGLVDFWSGDELEVDDGIQLLATPGHSPGSSVVVIQNGSGSVILSGDVVHHPIQLRYPEQPTAFDADPEAAAAARHRILSLAVETNALLLPAHFPGDTAPTLVAEGDHYVVGDWITVATPTDDRPNGARHHTEEAPCHPS